jgi:poly(ADP-ribose) glycohydrolase ARH3
MPGNQEITLRAKYLGCMMGSALGDAIGELAFRYPEEGRLRSAIKAREILPYTDDTAMALGLAASLAARGFLDQDHLGRTFHQNFLKEPWRGYASGPPTIFSLVQQYGISYLEAARSLFGGQGSFGNGAAMRVAPLGLFYRDSPDLYAQAAASAAVTHAHSLAQDGAAIQALAVAQAVKMQPQASFPRNSFLKQMRTFARTSELQEKLALVQDLLEKEVHSPQAASALGRSVAIHESLPFAIYAFLAHPQSFADCLFGAVLNGGDRDTLGAMAGALSGAYLGIEAIPRAWREKLENREVIAGHALSLLR